MNAPQRALFLLLLPVLFSAAPAAAEAPGLALSYGRFDIGQSEKASEAGIEYRFEKVRIFRLELTPAIGASTNQDGAVWAYAGFRWDLPLGERWVLTPNFATSLYDEGHSKDLGHVVEFRSGIEIARRLKKGRLGLALYHLSNASISDRNPGSESLILTWSAGR